MPPLLTPAFARLVVGHFLQSLGWTASLLLPLYLDHLRATRAEIGAALATGALAGLFARPVAGWAVDRHGRRRTLLVGTLLSAAALLLVAFVDRVGPLVHVHRALLGLAQGALFVGYFTAATDAVPEARRTEGLALFGIAGLLPLTLNALVDRAGLSGDQLRLVFPVAAGLVLASVAVVLGVEDPPQRAADETAPAPALEALAAPALVPVWLATVTFAGCASVFAGFVGVAAADRGLAVGATLWLPYGLGAVVVRLLGARVPDRVGPRNLVAPSLAALALSLVVASRATSVEAFLAAGALAGVGHGLGFPVLTSQAVTRVPPRRRGAALATFSALWQATELCSAPALGALADRLGDAWMLGLVPVVAAAAAVAWLGLEHRRGGA